MCLPAAHGERATEKKNNTTHRWDGFFFCTSKWSINKLDAHFDLSPLYCKTIEFFQTGFWHLYENYETVSNEMQRIYGTK